MKQKHPPLSPFNISSSIQEKLKSHDQTFLQEEIRKQNSQLSPYMYQESCVPQCYVQCLQCCGNQMVWMRLLFPCLCACVQSPFYKQSNANFGIVEKFGRYKKILQPGYNYVNPLTQKVVSVSRRTQMVECLQPVFTRDNIACSISSVVYFRVIDAPNMLYRLGANQLIPAVRQMAISGLRSVCAESNFQDLVEKRVKFTKELLKFVNNQLHVWGVYAQNIFVKDILIDKELQDVMSSVTITRRKAEASLIGARALVETARFFKQASEALDVKAAQQIRYLNTLNEISQLENPRVLMIHMDRQK